MLFVLPSTGARLFGLGLFVLCLGATKPSARASWLLFGATTILIGAAIYGFTLPGETPSHLLGATFGVEGALTGAAEMLRVLGFFSVGLLASRWIPVDEIMPLVGRRPMPLFITSSLLRLVPSIREEFARVRLVQTARGVEPGRLWSRPVRSIPVVVPVFVNTLRRAREQALALELAGLTRRKE